MTKNNIKRFKEEVDKAIVAHDIEWALSVGLPHGDKNDPFTAEGQANECKKMRDGIRPGIEAIVADLFEKWNN